MNLDRYDVRARRIIEKYFETIACTRLTGKMSESVKQREIKYWERFSVPVVIHALEIHLQKYPSMKESYTRGIMRNLELQGYQGREKQDHIKRKGYETVEDMTNDRKKEYEDEMRLWYEKKGVKLR